MKGQEQETKLWITVLRNPNYFQQIYQVQEILEVSLHFLKSSSLKWESCKCTNLILVNHNIANNYLIPQIFAKGFYLHRRRLAVPFASGKASQVVLNVFQLSKFSLFIRFPGFILSICSLLAFCTITWSFRAGFCPRWCHREGWAQPTPGLGPTGTFPVPPGSPLHQGGSVTLAVPTTFKKPLEPSPCLLFVLSTYENGSQLHKWTILNS